MRGPCWVSTYQAGAAVRDSNMLATKQWSKECHAAVMHAVAPEILNKCSEHRVLTSGPVRQPFLFLRGSGGPGAKVGRSKKLLSLKDRTGPNSLGLIMDNKQTPSALCINEWAGLVPDKYMKARGSQGGPTAGIIGLYIVVRAKPYAIFAIFIYS